MPITKTCMHCGRKIIPTEFGSWQDADNLGYEVCDLADEYGPNHEPETDPAVIAASFLSPEALAEAAANTQSLIESGDYEVT